MNKIAWILCCVLAGLVGFGAGALTGYAVADGETTADGELAQVLGSLGEGDSVELVIEDSGTVERIERSAPAGIRASSDRVYTDVPGFMDAATDAARDDKGLSGIQVNGHAVGAIGRQEGYGVLERFWNWLARTFWTVFWVSFLALAALGVMAFIPATAAFSRTALKAVAGVFPWVLGIIENIRGRRKEQAKVETIRKVVRGGDRFLRDELPTRLRTVITDAALYEQVHGVVSDAFYAAQRAEQDEASKADVRQVRQ